MILDHIVTVIFEIYALAEEHDAVREGEDVVELLHLGQEVRDVLQLVGEALGAAGDMTVQHNDHRKTKQLKFRSLGVLCSVTMIDGQVPDEIRRLRSISDMLVSRLRVSSRG